MDRFLQTANDTANENGQLLKVVWDQLIWLVTMNLALSLFSALLLIGFTVMCVRYRRRKAHTAETEQQADSQRDQPPIAHHLITLSGAGTPAATLELVGGDRTMIDPIYLYRHRPKTLGRGYEADLRFQDNVRDSVISRKHCTVFYDGAIGVESFILQDERSMNGTFVGRTQTPARQLMRGDSRTLEHGDYIALGPPDAGVILLFREFLMVGTDMANIQYQRASFEGVLGISDDVFPASQSRGQENPINDNPYDLDLD